MDANGYYLYLPAIFIYDDLEKLAFVDQMPEQFDRRYFLYKAQSGGYMTKYTPGMAILELPFFLLSHAAALLMGEEVSGYSPPYRLGIAFSSLFYSLLGLWILARLLLRYFRPEVVSASVLVLFIGSNLLFSTVIQAGVTHNYLFFIFALLMWFLDNWRLRQRKLDFAFACACVGFSALIRPTEILIGLVPLSYFVILKGHPFRISWWKEHISTLFIGILAFLLCITPIFFYWKFATGNWIAYTYEQEGFYFDRPWQIWYGLFGFRKGWFIYTPLAALSLVAGIRMLASDKLNPLFRAFLVYLPVNTYIVLSWYGWWYGGCFGNRAFVPLLAFLVIPLAWLLENAKPMAFKGIIAGFVLLISLNVFQTFQYQRQVMHMDAMTWRAYAYIFGKWKLNDDEKQKLKTLLDYPDYSQRGKKLDDYFH